MEAKRIPGKPGRTTRERIRAAAWDTETDGFSDDVIYLKDALSILDSPDEPSKPDMIQVTMTVEEAEGLITSLLYGCKWFDNEQADGLSKLHDLLERKVRDHC